MSKMKIGAIVPWFGSKRVLAPTIVEQLGPHRAYWEPFCGSMAVLMAKPECSSETANDLHGDLINLARVIRDRHYGPRLYRQLRRTLVHERLFGEAEAAINDNTPEAEYSDDAPLDLERAAMFFLATWLGRNGVAGTTKGSCGKQFCVRYTKNGGHQGTRFTSAVESIPYWRRRMREVCILRRDGLALLERVDDQEGTAIYVDPPYLQKSAAYVHDFSSQDHKTLANLLRRFKAARVVVSYYEHPDLAGLYPKWSKLKCTIAKGLAQQAKRGKTGRVDAPEVLLVNGPLFESQTEIDRKRVAQETPTLFT
jgi:DNA adenine methylase